MAVILTGLSLNWRKSFSLPCVWKCCRLISTGSPESGIVSSWTIEILFVWRIFRFWRESRLQTPRKKSIPLNLSKLNWPNKYKINYNCSTNMKCHNRMTFKHLKKRMKRMRRRTKTMLMQMGMRIHRRRQLAGSRKGPDGRGSVVDSRAEYRDEDDIWRQMRVTTQISKLSRSSKIYVSKNTFEKSLLSS